MDRATAGVFAAGVGAAGVHLQREQPRRPTHAWLTHCRAECRTCSYAQLARDFTLTLGLNGLYTPVRGSTRQMRLLSLTLALAGLAAPSLAQPPQAPRVSVAVAPPDVAAAPADAETTASGLKSKVLTAGSGTTKPVPLDIVTVHYTGWTAEGRLFDSSVLRARPSAFALDRIIAGWSEGLQLMVEGEKRRLWIPPGLAFEGLADRPQGPIVFDVELLDILGMPTAPPDVSAPPA